MMMHRRGSSREGGPMGAMRKGDKARNFKATMVKLAHYLSAYKFRIIIVVIFAVASTIFSIVGPKVLGNATTRLFEGVMAEIAGTGTIDFDYIGRILLIMLILYIFSATVCLCDGLDYGRSVHQHRVPLPQRDLRPRSTACR